MRQTVRIQVPEMFIGKWCLTDIYGTHGSYSIIALGGMVFENEEHAIAYRIDFFKDHPNIPNYGLEPMEITKDYPIWQTEMYICGLSTEQLKASSNETTH